MTVNKRTIKPLSSEALNLMIRDIRAAMEGVEPLVEAKLRSGDFFGPVTSYTNLTSRIEDLQSLTAPAELTLKGKCPVNLAYVCQDFAEGYAYRFGQQASFAIDIWTHHRLPIVSTYPAEVIRILDGVIRGYRNLEADTRLDITLTKEDTPLEESDLNEIIFSCRGPKLAMTSTEFDLVLPADAKTSEPFYIPELGLEFSAALWALYRLGGTARLRHEGERSCLELCLSLYTPASHTCAPSFPQDFYLFSPSPAVHERLFRMAQFHGIKIISVKRPEDATSTLPLVYDATNYSAEVEREILRLPQTTRNVILLPINDLSVVRRLAANNIRHFVDFPLVSNRLLRAISGLDEYIPAPEVSRKTGQRTLRALVVDDSAGARILVRDWLESLGHTVVEGADGRDLVRLIEAGERFDIIFCDLTMCHMDGVTAVRALRAYEAKKYRTPAVLITAYTEVAAEEHATAAGYDRVLRKPLDGHMIEQMLKELVRAKGDTASPAVTESTAEKRERRSVLSFFGWKKTTEQAVASAVPQSTQIFDLEDLRTRCRGKSKIMAQVLGAFLESSGSTLLELRKPEVRADPQALTRVIHTLKGLCLDAGAREGAETLKTLEMRLKAGEQVGERDFEQVEILMRQAQKSAASIQAGLQA